MSQSISEIDSATFILIKESSYPIAFVADGKYAGGSGFFIKSRDQTYFVTANHLFSDPISKAERNIKGISIYTNPDNWDEIGWEISGKEFKAIPVCVDGNCYDIALIPLNIPSSRNINYVDISFFENQDFYIDIEEIYISGYPHQQFDLIKTKPVDMNNGGDMFYTKDPSTFGASGAPVFAKGSKGEIFLSGIYSGRDTRNNRGQISKVGILIKFLMLMK
jgi:V8-like Glu-specific endopeptidase